MTAEEIKGFGFSEALQAISQIIANLTKNKPTDDRDRRRAIRHAKKAMKFLKRQLKKDGWEQWEVELWQDTIISFQKKIKEL